MTWLDDNNVRHALHFEHTQGGRLVLRPVCGDVVESVFPAGCDLVFPAGCDLVACFDVPTCFTCIARGGEQEGGTAVVRRAAAVTP